jgi:alanine dehydrogenase
MLIGVPKEIKDNEYCVGIVPSTVRELTDRGHRVLVETRAGVGAGFADNSYQTVTRQWLDSFRELWLGRLAILLMPYKWAVNALAEPGLMF